MSEEEDHQESGEDHYDPQPEPMAMEARAPDVEWDQVAGKGGLTFSTLANPKLVIHTTETKPEWGPPSYPYPPHLTIDLDVGDHLWQHVTLSKGAYAAKAGSSCGSVNYQLGAVYQVEHLGYAADTPGQGDTWYHNLARECVWFHRNKKVPLVFAPVWEDGSAYGSWSGRMGCEEAKAFSGILGHQHLPSPNDHWDPGRLDLDRLREAIEDIMGDGGGEEDEGMILKEGASGNGVKSLQRALNNWSEANGHGWKVQVDGTWGKGGDMTDRLKQFQGSLGFEKSGTLDGLTASYLVGRYDPPKL